MKNSLYWQNGTRAVVGRDADMIYISALYWGMVTLLTIGYGDLLPYTTGEKMVALVYLVIASHTLPLSLSLSRSLDL